MVIAALSAWHRLHEPAAELLAPVVALPAHAMLEAYSALTRMPGGLALAADRAAELLTSRFPEPPLALGAASRRRVLADLATAGVSGGAAYDGLIALEAAAHGEMLLTVDGRAAAGAYRQLAIDFRLLAA